jgi:hypothetical protein
MECDFIENVSIVTGATMNEKAFYDCTSLKTITLPNDLQTIKSEAFAECESLDTINIPTKVKTIGEQVFYNCRAIKNITMPDSVTEIASDVFNGTDLFGFGEVNLMATGGTITCSAGSYAQQYAEEHNIATNIVPSSELEVKNVGASVSKLSTSEYLVDVTDTNKFEGTVYVAGYDNSGKLVAAKSEKATADGVEYQLTFTSDEVSNIKNIKVFVWGGTNGITPLTTNVATPDMPA